MQKVCIEFMLLLLLSDQIYVRENCENDIGNKMIIVKAVNLVGHKVQLVIGPVILFNYNFRHTYLVNIYSIMIGNE